MIKNPDCLSCEHYHIENLTGMVCEAFPMAIPKDIIFSKIKHNKVLEGQVGDYVFKKKPDTEVLGLKSKGRTRADMKKYQISDKSFRIWNPNGTLHAEMLMGKWVKKPEDLKKK